MQHLQSQIVDHLDKSVNKQQELSQGSHQIITERQNATEERGGRREEGEGAMEWKEAETDLHGLFNVF